MKPKKPIPPKPPKLTAKEQLQIIKEIHKHFPPVYQGKTIFKGRIKPQQ